MKTDVRLTSLFAYHGEIMQKMGNKQKEVMEMFYISPEENMTNTELAEKLGWSINRVTPRVYELRIMSKLIEGEKRKCYITGRNAIAWKINE